MDGRLVANKKNIPGRTNVTASPEADGEIRPVLVSDNYGGFEDDIDEDEEGSIPAGFESIDEFLEDVRENHRLDIDADRFNREESLDDKKFMAGEQWDPAVLQQRQGLPCLIINQIPLRFSRQSPTS